MSIARVQGPAELWGACPDAQSSDGRPLRQKDAYRVECNHQFLPDGQTVAITRDGLEALGMRSPPAYLSAKRPQRLVPPHLHVKLFGPRRGGTAPGRGMAWKEYPLTPEADDPDFSTLPDQILREIRNHLPDAEDQLAFAHTSKSIGDVAPPLCASLMQTRRPCPEVLSGGQVCELPGPTPSTGNFASFCRGVVSKQDPRRSQLAAGDVHSLALRKDGTVACWGNNAKGQAPPKGRADGPFVAVAAGNTHSLALRKEDGSVACWGDNRDRQAPPNGRTDGPFVAVAAGGRHSLALRKEDGTVACWGNNYYRQAPPEGRTDGPFVAIAAGNTHSLALRENGTVACWGNNYYRQAPPKGRTDGPFVAIAAGNNHSLALRENGTVACWGDNRDRQAPPEGWQDI